VAAQRHSQRLRATRDLTLELDDPARGEDIDNFFAGVAQAAGDKADRVTVPIEDRTPARSMVREGVDLEKLARILADPALIANTDLLPRLRQQLP